MKALLCTLAVLGLPFLATPAAAQDGNDTEVVAPRTDGSVSLDEAIEQELSGESQATSAAPSEEAVPVEDGETGQDGASAPATPLPATPAVATPAPAPTNAAPTNAAPTNAAPTNSNVVPAGTDGVASGQQAAPSTPPENETPEQKGLRLAEEAKALNEGYRWQTASGRMILRDSQGNTNERQFNSRILEDQDKSDDEGVRGIIVFLHPPDIKNTALLTIGQEADDDYQWLYLPALKRVKRISGTGKTGSFVGSEFSYEDLSAAAIEDYSYAWLAEEPCPGNESLTCNVVERRPKDNDSGYSRIVGWEEQDSFRVFKTDFYDRKGTLLKTLVVNRQEKFKDRWWRAMDMTMTNHVTGKSTQMIWSAYDFDTPLSANDFTVRALERLQ